MYQIFVITLLDIEQVVILRKVKRWLMKVCTRFVNDDIVYTVKYSELKLSFRAEVWL
jgi:hypothetical protein